MQAGYYSSAWSDIKNSPGWFGKMCLMALLLFIPIFGPIVVNGYLYGWARDIAWDVKSPMPKSLFNNADGRLYSRGFFILVLGFVLSFVTAAVYLLCDGLTTGALITANRNPSALILASLIGLIILAVMIVAAILVEIFSWVGSMRISIYGNISSGFQFGKIWKMIRHDTGGIARIFLIDIVASLIVGVVFSIVFMIFFLFIGIGVFMPFVDLLSSDLGFTSHTMTMADNGAVISAFFSAIAAFGVFVLVFCYITLVASVFINTVVARALGYWTRQFNVAQWGPQEAPMPFEMERAQQSAVYQAMYQQQPQQYTQQSQQYAAPVVTQQPPAQNPAASAQPVQAQPAAADTSVADVAGGDAATQSADTATSDSSASGVSGNDDGDPAEKPNA